MNDIDPEDIRLQYRIDADNIEHLKRRQWLGMYYSLLLYAAIFSLKKVSIQSVENVPDEIRMGILFLLATFVLIFSLWFLRSTKGTLNEYRKRQRQLAETMCKKFREILPPEQITSKKNQDIVILGSFGAIHVTGWLILDLVILNLSFEFLCLFILFGFLAWILFIISCLTVES